MTIVTTAKHEATGWRGYLVYVDGRVIRRTVHLYPTAGGAHEAAERLRVPVTVPAPKSAESGAA